MFRSEWAEAISIHACWRCCFLPRDRRQRPSITIRWCGPFAVGHAKSPPRKNRSASASRESKDARLQERYDRPLSGIVVETTEDRLYFERGALHLWVRGKAMTPVPTDEWPAKARDVQQDARAVLAGAQLDAKTLRCASHGVFRLQASP
jgi:hypothetical protein